MEEKETEVRISVKTLLLGIATLVLVVCAVIVVKKYLEERGVEEKGVSSFGGFSWPKRRGRGGPTFSLLSLLKGNQEEIKELLNNLVKSAEFAMKKDSELVKLLNDYKGQCSEGTNKLISTLAGYLATNPSEDLEFYKALGNLILGAIGKEE
jgi:hypothetical protein